MKQYFYLTNNEFYSGIYQGQVIDMIEYLKTKHNVKIRLLSFLPLKKYFQGRALIKSHSKDAIVLPSMPKQSTGKMWKYNRILLYLVCILYRCHGIIARNTIAANLALYARKIKAIKSVCYDGRGAIAAESEEYQIYPVSIAKIIEDLERRAVLLTDYRICITSNLLQYWQERYNYSEENNIVIPGTLSSSFLNYDMNEEKINKIRKDMGYKTSDIILVYAGSTGAWQSFDLLYRFLNPQIEQNKNIKVLFLSKEDPNIEKLMKLFPEQIKRLWLKPSEVNEIMALADYGLIIREYSVTNKVALPTKFPEYLACGLNIIVNDAVDVVYDFVKEHNCGIALNQNETISLSPINFSTRLKNKELAITHYAKDSDKIKSKYTLLVQQYIAPIFE